jgi:hypothetical protein
MTYYEFHEAKEKLLAFKQKLAGAERGTPYYGRALRNYLYAVITVKGHAWCMDVAKERRKMSKLVAAAIDEMR